MALAVAQKIHVAKALGPMAPIPMITINGVVQVLAEEQQPTVKARKHPTTRHLPSTDHAILW